MHIEFTHVPGVTHDSRGGAATSFFFDAFDAARKLRLIEDAGFSRIVIDDPAGLLTNMDLAAQAIGATSSLGITLSHWAGVIAPTVAARQLAILDRASGGRLSVRMLPGADGEGDGHGGPPQGHLATMQRTDEYLVLLKRLWSNDKPFDHEGPFYRIRNGFVARKGARGGKPPLRMNGLSGTALMAAGRHADVFELAPGAPEDVGRVIERVRAAASECGRSAKIRFALPVAFDLPPGARTGDNDDAPAGPDAVRPNPVRFGGSPAHAALALLPYSALGISEFMIGGLDTPDAIETFGRRVAPLLRNSVARRDAPDAGRPLRALQAERRRFV